MKLRDILPIVFVLLCVGGFVAVIAQACNRDIEVGRQQDACQEKCEPLRVMFCAHDFDGPEVKGLAICADRKVVWP